MGDHALAADYSAGDPCPASGALHTTNDSDGVDVLVCDGSNWQAAISYYSAGGLSISSLSGQPAPTVTESIENIDDLADVDTSGKGTNDVLTWDGSSWGAAVGGGGGLWSSGTGDDIYYNSGTPQVGIGKTDPSVALDVVGDINFTGTLTDVSDRRQKDNLTPLENSLEGVLALQGYSFTMKGDGSSAVEYGLIAQEVETAFPELVITKSDGLKTLNYLGMIAPLVEATKAQQDDLDLLRDEVMDIKKENAALIQKIEEIEKENDHGHIEKFGE